MHRSEKCIHVRRALSILLAAAAVMLGCAGEADGDDPIDAGDRADGGSSADRDAAADAGAPDVSPELAGVALVDAASGEVVATVTDGTLLEVPDLACRCVRARALTGERDVGSVRFVIDGDETLDDAAPFEAPEGDGCLGAGTHSITATPHELAGGGGEAGSAESVTFRLISRVALPPTSIPAGIVPEPWDLASACGTIHDVSTREELEAALAVVGPGDGIQIAGGTRDWGEVTIPSTVVGTADRPVVIRSHGEPVLFAGSTRLLVRGSHVHLQGLSFQATVNAVNVDVDDATGVLPVGNRLSLIHCADLSGLCVYVGEATQTRIDHSLIERSEGKSVHVANESTLTRIDHNHFRDIQTRLVDGRVINGGEAIQLGHTLPGTVEAAVVPETEALVDHNVFQRAEAEGEMIGIKSGGNRIVLNVIVDAEVGHLSYRAGRGNFSFGNVFRDTRGGIRLHGTAPVAVHNLIVDPHLWEGIRMPASSDRLVRASNGNDYVPYVAARHGTIRHNTVVLTSHGGETRSRALAMVTLSTGECGGTCDVSPFGNTISRNVLVNVRGSATVGFSEAFAMENTIDSNVYWLGGSATLGVDPALTSGLVAGADDARAAHEALAEHVWAAPEDRCLRLERGAELDDATGVLFEIGACEARGEDAGARWLELDALDPAMVESLASWLAEQPAMVVPTIPPPR